MALKNGSSQTLGLLDVLASWEAFEVINRCHVTMRLEPERVGGRWKMRIHARAWDHAQNPLEAKLLASESSIILASEWTSLDVVVFRLLYALDGLLAEKELGEGGSGAPPPAQ